MKQISEYIEYDKLFEILNIDHIFKCLKKFDINNKYSFLSSFGYNYEDELDEEHFSELYLIGMCYQKTEKKLVFINPIYNYYFDTIKTLPILLLNKTYEHKKILYKMNSRFNSKTENYEYIINYLQQCNNDHIQEINNNLKKLLTY